MLTLTVSILKILLVYLGCFGCLVCVYLRIEIVVLDESYEVRGVMKGLYINAVSSSFRQIHSLLPTRAKYGVRHY